MSEEFCYERGCQCVLAHRGPDFGEPPGQVTAIHHAAAIGAVTRRCHPGHARHGFVQHELYWSRFIVWCECGAPLHVYEEDVRREMEDRELAAWSQSITNSISNGPSTANDLTIENLMLARDRMMTAIFTRSMIPPEAFEPSLDAGERFESFRGLPVPFGEFGTRIVEPA